MRVTVQKWENDFYISGVQVLVISKATRMLKLKIKLKNKLVTENFSNPSSEIPKTFIDR
jgi:hypothetical protein